MKSKKIIISVLTTVLLCGCSEEPEELDKFDKNAPINALSVLNEKDMHLKFVDKTQVFKIMPLKHIRINHFGFKYISIISKYNYNPEGYVYEDFFKMFRYSGDKMSDGVEYDYWLDALTEYGLVPKNYFDGLFYFTKWPDDITLRYDKEYDSKNQLVSVSHYPAIRPGSYKFKWLNVELLSDMSLKLTVNPDSVYEPKTLYVGTTPCYHMFFKDWEIEITAP